MALKIVKKTEKTIYFRSETFSFQSGIIVHPIHLNASERKEMALNRIYCGCSEVE